MNPTVSILMPCLNEKRYIRGCLDSLLVNDYAGEFDVAVIDGGSTDGTREIICEFCARDSRVSLVDNPKRTAPAALNIGIHRASGEIIIRVDAHALYPPGYISRCVAALLESGAANVGGIWRIVPGNPSRLGWAIAKGLAHGFGIGNAAYRLATATEPQWVDTVPFFCCKKSLFDKVGYFNECLTRTQDIEFNRRIRNAGGGILLCPDIEITYFARSDLGSMSRNAWRTGLWVVLPFLYSDVVPISWRHLTPLAFVVGLSAAGLASAFFHWSLFVLAGIAGAYVVCALVAAADIAVRERAGFYLAAMPCVFATLHISYGIGSLCGVWRVLRHILGAGKAAH